MFVVRFFCSGKESFWGEREREREKLEKKTRWSRRLFIGVEQVSFTGKFPPFRFKDVILVHAEYASLHFFERLLFFLQIVVFLNLNRLKHF